VKSPSIEYAVKAVDAATNVANSPASGAPYSIIVGKKPTPPRVVSTKPLDGAKDVPLESVIEISFSAAMDPVHTKAAFSITPAVPGQSSGFDPVLVFAPSARLAPGTKYTVIVSTAAKDLNGTALPAPYSFSFATAGPPGGTGGASGLDMVTTYVMPGALLVGAIVAVVGIMWFLMMRKRKSASPGPGAGPPAWQQGHQWQYRQQHQDGNAQPPPWNQP
jgi:hypothetical protein